MKLHMALALATVAFAHKGNAQNLIPFNSGFELGSPAGWYMWIDEKSQGNASFESTDEEAHSGSYSLRFDVKREAREFWQIGLIPPKWDAKPYTRYRVHFWAKGSGPLKVGATDVDKGYAWLGGFDANVSGGQWTEVSGEISTSSQSGTGRVSVALELGNASGRFYFDDMAIEEIGPLPAQ